MTASEGPLDGPARAEIGLFKAWLAVWIGAAIVAGLALGAAAPGALRWLRVFELGSVNLPIAALVWLLIFPTMVKVDFSRFRSGTRDGDWSKGLALTLATNWLVKPFTMAALAALFLEGLFAGLLPAADARGYVAGLILLGAAPCTGMVFVWSRMSRGDPTFTVIQVAINDLVLLAAFAPLGALLLGVVDVPIPWSTLLLSTAAFVVLPLAAGNLARRRLLARGGEAAVNAFGARFEPLESVGLLLLVVLLFGLQAERVLGQPWLVLLIAVPLLLQAYGIFAVAWGWAWAWRLPTAIAAPAAFIGTSNFFELAIAVAISLFGFDSPAALATVVGVLVEVPVMLSLVAVANRSRRRIDARAGVA